MSAGHQHRWIIATITAIVTGEGNTVQQRVPMDLRAELHCEGCSAALSDLTMAQLKMEIDAGHVQGDSMVQWASIAPLFWEEAR